MQTEASELNGLSGTLPVGQPLIRRSLSETSEVLAVLRPNLS